MSHALINCTACGFESLMGGLACINSLKDQMPHQALTTLVARRVGVSKAQPFHKCHIVANRAIFSLRWKLLNCGANYSTVVIS